VLSMINVCPAQGVRARVSKKAYDAKALHSVGLPSCYRSSPALTAWHAVCGRQEQAALRQRGTAQGQLEPGAQQDAEIPAANCWQAHRRPVRAGHRAHRAVQPAGADAGAAAPASPVRLLLAATVTVALQLRAPSPTAAVTRRDEAPTPVRRWPGAGVHVLRITGLRGPGPVQGYMFRAAFLRKVPLFVRDFAENVLLCLLAAGVESTSRRFLERLKLFWRATLTERIHRTYFSSMVRGGRARLRRVLAQRASGLSGTAAEDVLRQRPGMRRAELQCWPPLYVARSVSIDCSGRGVLRTVSPLSALSLLGIELLVNMAQGEGDTVPGPARAAGVLQAVVRGPPRGRRGAAHLRGCAQAVR